MAKAQPPRMVLCYHCRHRFEVGGRTMSVPCPACHKPLIVEDVIVKTYKPVKNLQTCGMLIIRRGGRVTATNIEAQLGIDCQGALAGDVVSGGPVNIGPKGEWKGNLRAPSLAVKGGARILGGRFAIPEDPLRTFMQDQEPQP